MWLNTANTVQGGQEVFTWTAPNTTIFDVGAGSAYTNASGVPYSCWCFAPIEGFSKFDAYYGNGSPNGPFIYTGFKPAWVLIKSTNNASSWGVFDNARDPINPVTKAVWTNGTQGQSSTYGEIDFLSNGFKLRTADGNLNAGNGYYYIYMAFAEQPFGGSNVYPATAR